MDTKQIVTRIDLTSIINNQTKKEEPVLSMEIKTIVKAFTYEIYSNKGYYLKGTYMKESEIGTFCNNGNRFVFNVKKDITDTKMFIRLSNVKILNPGQRTIIDIDDPIFYFYDIKCDIPQNIVKTNIEVKLDESDSLSPDK